VTHAYTSESYRDPVTKKPRTHRTYLGRVDPVTGAIIPKGPPGSRKRSKLSAPDNERTLPPEIKQLISDQTDAITRMKADMDKVEARNRELLLTPAGKLKRSKARFIECQKQECPRKGNEAGSPEARTRQHSPVKLP